MTLRLYALSCGWLSAPLGLLLEGESGAIRIPFPAIWSSTRAAGCCSTAASTPAC